jgi:hypothetical protein
MSQPGFKEEKTVVILARHPKELLEIFHPNRAQVGMSIRAPWEQKGAQILAKSEEWDSDSHSIFREMFESEQRWLGQMQSHFSTTLMFEDWSDAIVIDVILSLAAAQGEKFHEDAVVELRNSLRQLRAGRLFGNRQPSCLFS